MGVGALTKGKNQSDMWDFKMLVIWCIRNPTEKRFTWRQKTPLIQRRLDYLLISNDLQEDVESVDNNSNKIRSLCYNTLS